MTDLRKMVAGAEQLTLEELKELSDQIRKLIGERELDEARKKEKTIYQFEYKRCGRPNCKKCKGGRGHGPYWYAYTLDQNGNQHSVFLGKDLQRVGLGPGTCSECGQPPLEGSFLCLKHTAVEEY